MTWSSRRLLCCKFPIDILTWKSFRRYILWQHIDLQWWHCRGHWRLLPKPHISDPSSGSDWPFTVPTNSLHSRWRWYDNNNINTHALQHSGCARQSHSHVHMCMHVMCRECFRLFILQFFMWGFSPWQTMSQKGLVVSLPVWRSWIPLLYLRT